MKKNTILIILQIVFCLSGFAQHSDYYCEFKENHDKKSGFEPRLRGKIFVNEFRGENQQNIYFNDWTQGKVILKDSTVVGKKYLRYNRYIDELLYLRTSDYKMMVVDKDMLRGFELMLDGNEKKARFVLKKFKPWYVPDTMQVFLQVLEEGKVGLYVARDTY